MEEMLKIARKYSARLSHITIKPQDTRNLNISSVMITYSNLGQTYEKKANVDLSRAMNISKAKLDAKISLGEFVIQTLTRDMPKYEYVSKMYFGIIENALLSAKSVLKDALF